MCLAHILWQMDHVRGKALQDCVRKDDLKKETKGLIMSAQEQTLQTNAIKVKIEKQDIATLSVIWSKRRA